MCSNSIPDFSEVEQFVAELSTI